MENLYVFVMWFMSLHPTNCMGPSLLLFIDIRAIITTIIYHNILLTRIFDIPFFLLLLALVV